MNPLTILTTFVAIFPAELPDKTTVASMVLSTRYRHPWAVWAGATVAFVVHVALAVLAGRLLTLLPERPVQVAVAGLFALGAVMLWRDGATVGDESEVASVVAGRTILRVLPVKIVRRAAAVLFAGLAAYTLTELLRG